MATELRPAMARMDPPLNWVGSDCCAMHIDGRYDDMKACIIRRVYRLLRWMSLVEVMALCIMVDGGGWSVGDW